MCKIKKVIIISIIFISIILVKNQVQAVVSVSLASDKNAVYVGDEFSISVNLSGASVVTLTTRITVDTSKVEYISGPSNSNFSNGKVIYTWTDPNGGASPISSGTIATFKFRAKSTGIANFSITGDFYDADENQIIPKFTGKTITINGVPTQSTTPSEGGGNSNTSGATNSGDSSSGNQNTTTLSSNSYLKSLQLNVEGISPKFNKSTTQYYITVSNLVNSINVTAKPEDSEAKVAISGNTDLKIGVNKINIIVTAQNGKNKRTYTINVTKTDDPNKANSNLENLAIENNVLIPEFSAEVTDYAIDLQQDLDSLNILAVPQNENAKVEILGNGNLKIGENKIQINVIAEDKVSIKTYTIIVNKKENIEVINQEENINQNQNEEENKTGNNLAVIALSMLAILALISGICYKKIKNKRMLK